MWVGDMQAHARRQPCTGAPWRRAAPPLRAWSGYLCAWVRCTSGSAAACQRGYMPGRAPRVRTIQGARCGALRGARTRAEQGTSRGPAWTHPGARCRAGQRPSPSCGALLPPQPRAAGPWVACLVPQAPTHAAQRQQLQRPCAPASQQTHQARGAFDASLSIPGGTRCAPRGDTHARACFACCGMQIAHAPHPRLLGAGAATAAAVQPLVRLVRRGVVGAAGVHGGVLMHGPCDPRHVQLPAL